MRNTGVSRGGLNRPCGRCAACLANRVSNWSFRLRQEDKVSESSYFLTLTYDNDHLPITKNGFMDLRVSDLQKYFKRLRKAHEGSGGLGKPLKYYAVGEYGGRFHRPHYHILLFNARLSDIISSKFAALAERGIIELDGQTEYDIKYWGYEKKVSYTFGTKKFRVVHPEVRIGHGTIGMVSGASVGYTMKYISKQWRPWHKNDDRTPQFSISSNGLGINYLTNQMVDWHRSDMYNRQYCLIEDGKKIPLPRYYKDKIYSIQDMENIRAYNALESMKEVDFDDLQMNARDRSEALYAGMDRFNQSLLKNQKL